MKESDLLQYCRYYKDERKNPYEGKEQNKAMLWMYERAWIHDTMAVIARGMRMSLKVEISMNMSRSDYRILRMPMECRLL